VPFLEAADLHTLNEGQPAPGGVIAVIAPGTGLGEAFLTWDGSRYRAHASEGGHTDFAPTNALEAGLLRYLLGRFEHVSYERVCSGRGLPNIYAYLKDSGYAEEPPWLAEQLASVEDPNPIIVNAALYGERPCELCVAMLNTFVSILGTEAGNLALKVLATGGVYLGGGIPPRILPALEQEEFIEAFRRKGRMSDLLARVPVHVILNPKVALLGAACHGLEL
jgi:glucokinase